MGNRTNTTLLIAVPGLCVGLFILDLYLPLGVANGVLYAGVVLLASRAADFRFSLIVAAACSVLTIAGALLSPVISGVPLWLGFSNRFFSILAIWVPVVFFQQHRRAADALRRANEALEQRVQARTRDLARVNQALVEEISERMETERSLRTSEVALEVSQQELRGLAARLLTTQDEERRRISRDLHDDVNQRLAMLTVDVDALERNVSSSPELIGRGLRSIRDRLIELSDDVRRLAYEFHPSILDDLGLPIALQRLVDDFSARTGLNATFDRQNITGPFPPEISSCIYRVAQESLGNVAKHARASHVAVTLADMTDGLTLSVRDTGVGFTPDRTDGAHTGLGLISMQERVRLVDGTMTIDSRAGEGTVVQVWIPLVEGRL